MIYTNVRIHIQAKKTPRISALVALIIVVVKSNLLSIKMQVA